MSEATQNKKSWDSNAITPGTPFMDLLAASLRYRVSHKLNTDPGWKDVSDLKVQVIFQCVLILRIWRNRSKSLSLETRQFPVKGSTKSWTG